jgi:hypothetical protein
MYLCELVIQKRMTLHLPLEPKITLRQRRKLTICHLCWFNSLPQLHLPTVLFISNDQVLIQFFALPQRVLFKILPLILMQVLLKNYSIVEYLMQAPSVMSALEVLQSCPTQWKELLKAIGGIDPTDANLIIFDLEDHIPRLPPQLAFQIQVFVTDKNICRTVIDEGASTCIMFVACWKSIGSPPLTESHNTLKAFNGSGFKPYGVLPPLPITLEAKSINVEVEVFYTPLDYNLLLGRSWIDSMLAVVSTLFYVVRFPHQDKVVAVDQLAFFNSDARTSNVPLISKTPLSYENVGVGLLKDSTLMGTFLIPRPNVPAPLVASINMISTCIRETPASFDPWIIPASGYYLRYGGQKPLSPVESRLSSHSIRKTFYSLSW